MPLVRGLPKTFEPKMHQGHSPNKSKENSTAGQSHRLTSGGKAETGA